MPAFRTVFKDRCYFPLDTSTGIGAVTGWEVFSTDASGFLLAEVASDAAPDGWSAGLSDAGVPYYCVAPDPDFLNYFVQIHQETGAVTEYLSIAFVDWSGQDDGGFPPDDGLPPDDDDGDGGTKIISLDISEAGRRIRAYVAPPDGEETGNNLWVGYGANFSGSEWLDRDTAIAGTYPCIRYEKQSRTARAWLAYVEGGVKALYSDDEGSTWSDPMTIATAGKHPRIVQTRDGRHILYWIDGGALKGQFLDSANLVMQETFTGIASGVDYFDMQEEFTVSGGWRLFAFIRSGTNLRTYASDAAGKVWTEITA